MKYHPDIRTEESFLIGICRLEFDESLKKELLKEAAVITDWKYFARLANEHGVAALAYNNLEKTGLLGLVPPEIAAFLRNASFMSLARNARNMVMMQEVLDILKDENLKMVLLKGMALELMIYGNRGLRQMTDADVLLEYGKSLKAYRQLMIAGYTPLPVKSYFHRMIVGHYGKHLPSLIKKGFSIEIHHELFGRDNHFLTEKLLTSAVETTLSGRKVWLAAPQVLFLYLVKHLDSHEENNDSQLRLYTDLVVMIDKYGSEVINDELFEMADQAGMNGMLATKLWCLHEFWGMKFSSRMVGYIDLNRDPTSMGKFIFFLRSPKNNPLPDKSERYREIFSEVPGFHRKMLYFLGDLFPSVSFMKKRYGCSSSLKAIMYYPHRWGKIWWLIKR